MKKTVFLLVITLVVSNTVWVYAYKALSNRNREITTAAEQMAQLTNEQQKLVEQLQGNMDKLKLVYDLTCRDK